MEKEKEEKEKLVSKYETEKEMLMRKANNLKKGASPMRRNESPKPSLKSQEIILKSADLTDEEEMKITSNKIYNKKNIVNEIESDLDNISLKSEVSDCTSMSSSQTMKTGGSDSEYNTRGSVKISERDRRKKYQEFVKVMLKVKFEKIHNTHKGQEISEKDLFYECVDKLKLEPSQWQAYIIDILRDPKKCQDIINGKTRKRYNTKDLLKYILLI